MLGARVQGGAPLEVAVEGAEPEEGDPAPAAPVHDDGAAVDDRAQARGREAEVGRGLVELEPRRGRRRGETGSRLFGAQSSHVTSLDGAPPGGAGVAPAALFFLFGGPGGHRFRG
jgi:hypothetical protein